MHDPSDVINDEDFKGTIQELQQLQPYCGVSMVWGNLRARGIKVTRREYDTCFEVWILLVELCGVFLVQSGGSHTLSLDLTLWHIGIFLFIYFYYLLAVYYRFICF